jgi:hypothetical protein
VIERAIRTLKETVRSWRIPYGREQMRLALMSFVDRYNEFRPHTALAGRTPDEAYFREFPANRRPRIEPRCGWPRGSPCAGPHAVVAGNPGARFDVEVEYFDGRRELPIIRLRRAA